jgi:hypothetical protein
MAFRVLITVDSEILDTVVADREAGDRLAEAILAAAEGGYAIRIPMAKEAGDAVVTHGTAVLRTKHATTIVVAVEELPPNDGSKMGITR